MKTSIAHKDNMNHIGEGRWPGGLVPWDEPQPPGTYGITRIGRLRSCAYCGSLHPTDVASFIKSGAVGSWADQKYGWPHKVYFDKIPNPHAGLLEVRASANFKSEGDWIQYGDNNWHESPKPAAATTSGKFYSVHLMDATPEERDTIERHLGLHFEFKDGKVSWKPT